LLQPFAKAAVLLCRDQGSFDGGLMKSQVFKEAANVKQE
jgi:hypothetical protein